MTLPKRLPRKPRREGVIRSPGHLKWIRSHMCSVPGCTVTPIEAAHVRRGTDGGTSLKPGDCWAISLCVAHHIWQHKYGEQSLEQAAKIDMKALAEEFWRKSPHRRKVA